MNLALTAFSVLGFEPEKYLSCLAEVNWPGRMQRLWHSSRLDLTKCPVYLSGDHNPQGMESLIDLLSYYEWNDLRLVVGIGFKKDMDAMLKRLLSLPRMKVWLTRAEFQGRTQTQYGDWLTQSQGFFEDPLEALAAAIKDAKETDLCLVTGSLYLVGDVLRRLPDLRPVDLIDL